MRGSTILYCDLTQPAPPDDLARQRAERRVMVLQYIQRACVPARVLPNGRRIQGCLHHSGDTRCAKELICFLHHLDIAVRAHGREVSGYWISTSHCIHLRRRHKLEERTSNERRCREYR